MFKHGDILRQKRNDLDYFIVVDLFDYSLDSDKEIIEYELMQIYPYLEHPDIIKIKNKQDYYLVTREGTSTWNRMVGEVIEEHINFGWNSTPDFLMALEENKKLYSKYTQLSDALKGGTKEQMDVIRYDNLKTVNECLDALNDLQQLHNVFGDEAYLQLREVVMKRLKELIKV